jgi:hypothetical protein
MGKIAVTTIVAALFSTAAFAQTSKRWYAGGSVSEVRVDAEEVKGGGTASIGAVVGVQLTPTFSIEFEGGLGLGELGRVYSGKFVSFAGPGASREEIERLAVTMQSDTRWKPRGGGSVFAVWRSTGPSRIGAAVFGGLTATAYDVRNTLTVVEIPTGVDATEPDLHRMMPDSHGSRMRGGLTAGLLVPVRLSRDLSIAPEVRYTYGSFGDEIYTVLRGGARILWRF